MPIRTASWTPDEEDLWRRIAAHDFEPGEQAFTFTARLARDHRWSLAYARAAIEEYRRFCFLAVTSTGQMTPSEDVDEVWHLHLTFSRDYWDHWCGRMLCRPLHHQPTQGGSSEAARFAAQYACTLARYETYFGAPNPIYWPGTAQRFRRGSRFRTVDLDRTMVVPLPAGLGRWMRRSICIFGLVGSSLTTRSEGPSP